MIIRAAKPNDFQAWATYYKSKKPKQNRWDSGPKTPCDLTNDKFQLYLDSRKKWSIEDFVHTYYGFTESGKIVGRIEIGTIARQIYQMANIYYEVSNLYWNKGIGTLLAQLGVDFAFEKHTYNRVEFAINKENLGSIRIAEKLKMKNEGLKEKYLLLGGKWLDFNIFTMRSDIWKKRH